MNSFHLGKNKRLKEERFFPRSQSCLSADPPIPRPELCPPYPVAPPSLFSPCKSSSWKQHCLAFPSIRIEGFEDWEGFTNHCGWPAGRMTNAPFFFFWDKGGIEDTALEPGMAWAHWWAGFPDSGPSDGWIYSPVLRSQGEISLAQRCLWHSHLANGIAGAIKSDYGFLSFHHTEQHRKPTRAQQHQDECFGSKKTMGLKGAQIERSLLTFLFFPCLSLLGKIHHFSSWLQSHD